jgi:hypothetical protein
MYISIKILAPVPTSQLNHSLKMQRSWGMLVPCVHVHVQAWLSVALAMGGLWRGTARRACVAVLVLSLWVFVQSGHQARALGLLHTHAPLVFCCRLLVETSDCDCDCAQQLLAALPCVF